MKRERILDSIEQLDRDMNEKSLEGHWSLGLEDLPPYPVTSVQPHLWRWEDVHESLLRAGEVVSLEDAERRTVRLLNPGIPGGHGTTHTIHVSFQYVKDGEYARAHRHSAAAFRFVLQGRDACTTVNGQQCVMEEGDLILTPQLSWHDHVNDSGKPILWLDGLDIPLTQALHQLFFEPYRQERQTVEATSDDVTGFYGHARPAAAPPGEFFHYKWADTERDLERLRRSGKGRDPFDGCLLEFRNPVTGGPTMPTIQCAVQLLEPGRETAAHRHTSTAIYHVYRGAGATIIGGREYQWRQGDSFVVPLWSQHAHSASTDAILLSMSDAPVMKALDLYREAS